MPKTIGGYYARRPCWFKKYVYATGFSGHILRFSTGKPAYLGEVKVTAASTFANKLSGSAFLDNGKRAITTVENRHESFMLDLHMLLFEHTKDSKLVCNTLTLT